MSTLSVQPVAVPAGGAVPALSNMLATFESASAQAQSHILTELVSQVYASAPLTARRRLLETMLRPMGVLGLVSIAGGIFAKLRFGMGLQDTHLRLEDVGLVDTSDVAALVDRLQQVSHTAMLGLANVVSTSPALASSTAASVLMMLLFRKGRERRRDDFEA